MMRKHAAGHNWDELYVDVGLAASRGNIEALNWALENGYIADMHICMNSALSGKLEALKWARQRGCPWDERTCSLAALNGNLDVLKWARENGCPWDESTYAHAAMNWNSAVLEWVRENGCPCPKDNKECADAFKRKYDADRDAKERKARWAANERTAREHLAERQRRDQEDREEREKLDEQERAAKLAAEVGDLKKLKQMRAGGLDWRGELGLSICKAAAANGHLGLLQWVRMNGCPWNKGECQRLSSCHDDVNHWIIHDSSTNKRRHRKP